MRCVDAPSDLSGVLHVTNATEFCSFLSDCGSCSQVQRACPGGCTAEPTTPQGVGSGDGSNVMPSAPELLCLDQRIEPSPTIAPESSIVPESSIAPSPSLGDVMTITTMVEQTVCPTTSCEATPSAMPSATPTLGVPQCGTVRTVNAVCIGYTDTMAPVELMPCDDAYCEPESDCQVCRGQRCQLPFCNYDFTMECENYWSRVSGCNGRKKRSEPLSDSPLLPLDFPSRNRHKRQAISNCVLDEMDPFNATIENFTDPVECRIVVSPTSTPGPAVGGVCSRPQIKPSLFTEAGFAECSPPETAFNPCQDLLGASDSLRGAIWVVVILAFVGNGLVFIVFIGYSVIVRRTKQDLFVVHFLYFNLAVADFLMGVYLFIIAIQDARTRGSFYISDISWRLGSACEFAGFCAITSTSVSVYILMVITLERTYTIMRVLNHKKLTKKRAVVTVIIGWIIGLSVASLPLFYFSDYNSVAICLPFNVENPQSLAYVVILLLGTGIAFIVIAVCYVLILQQIMCSRRKNSPYIESRRRLTSELKVAIRIFVLIFTNFACWLPIALLGLSAAFGESLVDDLEFARWAIVFIFPINACLNPILYSLTTRAFRDNFVLLFNQFGLCKERAQQIRNVQVGIPSYTSKTSTSGIGRVKTTVVMRFRSLSLSSQSSMIDLFGRRNRRASTMSQNSEEGNHIAMLNARRRNSALSDDSAREMLGRARSDSTFSGDSEDAGTILNSGFRTSSPEGVKPPIPIFNGDLRARVKVSASSLEALPEEVEFQVEDEHVVKVNPAFCDEEDGGVARETKLEGEGEGNQRDSGVGEGSENDSGEVDVEVIVTPPPQTYQLKTKGGDGPDES